MQGSHKHTHRYLSGALIAIFAALSFLFLASRDSVAARLSASPAARKIAAAAPEAVRRTIKTRLAPSSPLNGLFAATLNKSSNPPSGSFIYPGQQIEYTINLTNDGVADATAAGNFLRVDDVVPANTTLVAGSLSVLQQPGSGGNAWTCAESGGTITCQTGSGGDLGAADTFKFRFLVTVNAATPPGTVITNSATYRDNANTVVTPAVNSNQTTHTYPSADLSVSKLTSIVPPAVVTAGLTTFKYTVTVTNGGPNAAPNVVMNDTLPPGMLFNSVNLGLAPGFNCVTPGVGQPGTVSCSKALMANGESATIEINVAVAANALPGPTINTARAFSDAADANLANNEDTDDDDNDGTGTLVQTSSSFFFTKTAQPNPAVGGAAVGGGLLTYTITAFNNGPSNATSVFMVDDLTLQPVDLASVTLSNITGYDTCSYNSGIVTCFAALLAPNLPPGAAPSVTVTMRVNPDAATFSPINNDAFLFWADTDPNTPDTAIASTSTPVVNLTDITVKKDASPDAVTAGQNITYTIKVTNNGPSVAPGGTVTVADALSPLASVNLAGATINLTNAPDFAGCTAAALTGAGCASSGVITPGEMNLILLTVPTQPGAPVGNIQNTATVSTTPSGQDPIPGNNTAIANVAVGPNTDLTLSKTAGTSLGFTPNAPVTAGGAFAAAGPLGPLSGTIEYVLSYANNGPSTATNVMITDVLPGNTLPIAGSLVAPGPILASDCQILPSPGSGNQIKCAKATLAAGASGTITFRVRVPANVAQGTVIRNQAQITSDTPDSNTSSNVTNETQNTVVTSADLTVDKSDSVASVVAGNNVTYLIRVNNLGPSNAQNVVANDLLDPNTTFVSVTGTGGGPLPAGWSCNTPAVGSAGIVSCTIATLPAGSGNQDLFVTVRVRPEFAGASVSNTSTVSSSTPDAVANNSDTETTPVTRDVTLSITKSAAPDPVVAGANLTYTITAGNSGPSAALGATVTDNLSGLPVMFISASGTGIFGSGGGGCSFNAGTGVVTCTPAGGVLPPGASEIITIVVKVNPNVPPGPLGPNTATVTSTNPAEMATSAPVNVNVIARTDLTIKKDDSPDAVQTGQNISYTLEVTNNGPSDAPINTVMINDPIPGDTNFNTGSINTTLAPGFTCSFQSNAVKCVNSAAAFPAGAKAIIKFNVQVNSGSGAGTIMNTATVSTTPANQDPNPNNNTASETTSFGPFADLELNKQASPTSVLAGGPSPGSGALIFTITYRNNGPSGAQNVQIRDTIPANLQPQGTIFAPGMSCNGDLPLPGVQIICSPVQGGFGNNGAGFLPSGASGQIEIIVNVPANVPAGTLITNQATIASYAGQNNQTPPTPDPNPANNTQAPTSTLVTASANLSINKNANQNTVTAGGGAFDYTLNVSNNGPSDAQNVVVNDNLPAGIVFVSVQQTQGTGFTCAGPAVGQSGTVTCTKGVMAAGETARFRITARVPADVAAATRTNTATVQSATPDSQSNNNSSSVQTQIVTDANVTIAKSDSPNPVIAGNNLTYFITVGNSGPSTASNVTLTDAIPANTTFVSASGSGILSNCSHNGGIVSCLPGALAVGESDTLTLVVKVNPDAPSQVSNTANVTWTDSDSNPGSQQATQNTTVNKQTDLSIKKTDSPHAVQAGNQITYTITVKNNGPSAAAANGVVVKDSTPANTTDVSVVGTGPFAGCTLANLHGAGCANSAPMAPGEQATLTYKVTVNANTATGFITNTTTVAASPSSLDPNTTNNSATTQTAVGSNADLQLTKTSSPASVVAGGPAPGNGQINYTITYRNNGPSNAAGVQITDTVSANLVAIAGATINAPGLSCHGQPVAPGVQFSCSPNANAFGSNAAGVLPNGAEGVITYSVRVPANVAQGSLIANAALINSLGSGATPATPDPNPSNNSQNATSTLVNTSADLTINKSSSANSATAGGSSFTYTLNVTNNGVSDAQNVVVNDNLPAGIVFNSVQQTVGGGFTCAGPGAGQSGTVTCSKGVMAAGETAQFVITAQVPSSVAATTRVNVATAQSATSDPNLNNNSSSVQTQIVTDANVTISKIDNQDPVIAGANLTYTITVANSGPSRARNVTLSDPIPAGTTFVSLSGSGILANCAHSAGTITCSPDSLGAGESATLTVVVKVNPDAPSQFSNTATVTWTDSDSNPGSQQATQTTTVNKQTDLSIKKSDSPHAVQAGNQITYTITVKNNGPSAADAGGVVVKDSTPANTTDVSVVGTGPFAACTLAQLHGAGCANSSQMAPGEQATLVYKVTVNPGTPTGFINNTATVAASPANLDPNTTNNSATTQTAVGPHADLQLTKTSSPASVLAGGPAPGVGQINYTITYRNNGPSDAVGVEITDTVSANLMAIPGATINAPGLSCHNTAPAPGAQFVCAPNANAFGSNAAGVLPINASGTITYSVQVPANVAQGSLIANAALITSLGSGSTPATPDPNTSNNSQNATSTLVNTSADLAIAKASSAAAVTAGGLPFTYTLSVVNNGFSDAQNVAVSDALPQGIAFVSVVNTIGVGFTCAGPAIGQSGTVTCAKGVMAAGETAQFVITALSPSDSVAATRTNTAVVQSSTSDPNSANNAASVQTQIVTDANVTISKIDNPDPVVAGANLTYTITVANAGPSHARNVTLSDAIPANTSFVALAGSGIFSACAHNNGNVTCPAGALGDGASATLTLTVKVNPDSPTGAAAISNTATAQWTDSDSTPGSVSATQTTTVNRQTDLSIKKSDSPHAVQAGNQITYTITVKNDGPSTASAGGVVVTDATPANTTDVSVVGSGPFASCTLAQLHGAGCANSAPMAPGEQATLVYKVNVNPGTPTGFITNTATVAASPAGNDPNTSNNSAATQTAVGPHADLQLTKSSAPVSVVAGGPAPGSGQINYTITYRNNGPSDAAGVNITDTVSANLMAIAGATISAPGLSCNGAAPAPGAQFICAPLANAFGSNAAGVLPTGASGTITYSVRVPASVASGTLIANAALITSLGSGSTPATPDPNPSNNSQNATSTLVTTSADLAIAKASSAGTVTAGGATFTYTLDVTNGGVSDAQNVVVTDTLPQGLIFASVAQTIGGGFTCVGPGVGNNGPVTCSKGVMAAGEAAQFVITARAQSNADAATRTNTASVQSNTSDPNNGNNSSSVQTQIVTDANVTITKIDNPDPVVAGANLTYTVTVTNLGPSQARNVTLNDPIPANTTFVSLAGSDGFANCAHSGGSVTCPASTLGVNESATVTVVVKVNPNAPAGANTISNTATVQWTDSNSNPGSQQATATTTVNRQTDLTVTKSDSPRAVLAGNQITYTIKVKNGGPSTAATGEVVLKDATPANTTDVSVAGTGPFAGCTLAQLHGAGCANSAPMAPGDEATLTYKVTVNAGTPTGFITNTATVEANPAGNDPNTTNNSAVTQTAVGPNADLQLTKTSAPSVVVAGGPAPGSGQITYTITYRNDGPSDAAGVNITDTVSANLAAAGVINAPGLSCNGATATPGAQFTCSPLANAFGSNAAGVLPTGASGTLSYNVRVPASVASGTLVANAAQITSLGSGSTPATPDPNPSNNSQNATSTLVNTSADLSITKSDSPDPVTAGGNLTWTLTVSNAGPSDAQNVVVTDSLPANTTFVSVTPSDASFSCTAPSAGSGGVVTCNKATLASGASATITLIAQVRSSTTSGTTISNTATVAAQTSDPSAGNNSATTTTFVNTSATLTVAKSDSPDPVVAGANLTYTITVTNNGPSDAQNVTLNDSLPANTSFVSLNGSGAFQPAGACSHNGAIPGVVSCGGGLTLPANQSATLTVVVKVASNAQVAPPAQPINNTVTVSSSTDSGSPRTASTSTNVKREADMQLTKTAPASVIAGQNVDYTLRIKNNGLSDVDGGSQPGSITVVDTLPTGVTPLQPLASPNLTISGPGGWTCSFDSASGKLTCANAAGDPGDFPAGAIATIIFKARVASNAPDNTNLNNCAAVSLAGPEVDPVSGNNNSCASTVVHTSADLGAGKTAPQQGVAGQNITFNLTFGNAGPSDAVNVRITDVIPANTTYQAPAAPFTVLAVGGVFTSANSVRVECSLNGNTLTCTPKGNTGLTPSLPDGVLPAGVTGAFSYDVKINASVQGGTIVANGVNISSAPAGGAPGTPDPNPGNNTSLPTSTVVIAQSQLMVTKAIAPNGATFAQAPPAPNGAVVPGTNLTWRLSVTNNGPSDVNNVQVVDTLPSNTTYISAVPAIGSGFTCLPANGGVVTCNAPLLPTGVTRTIDIRVAIDPATKESLVNKADATGITSGFNVVINSPTFTLTTPVGPTSDLVLTKTHQPEPVVAGTNVTYTLTLKNNGPSTAAMTQVVDTLPAGQTLAAAPDVSAAPGFTCVPSAVGSAGPITCSADALAPNAQVVIRITAKVDPSLPAGIYNNTATATSMSFDPTPASVTDPVTVITRADLAVNKIAPATAVAGTQMTYTITAANNGPSSASNMVITDQLPTGAVFISATGPGSSLLSTPVVGSNGIVKATWNGLTLPGVTRQLTIVVRVCSEVACDTNISNTATASSDTVDPDTTNNSSTATTKTQAVWDLSIAKSGPATTAPDSTITYTLTVTNTGPSNSANTVVTDVLPKGFTVAGTPSINLSGATATVSTNSATGQQTVTANLGSVGGPHQCSTSIPQSVIITIVVRVTKTMPFTTVTNTAAVASSVNCAGGNQGDSDPANNAASLTTRIVNSGPEVGLAFPADAEVSDQKAGSVLVFPIYSSDAANSNRENTRITLTNTHGTERACIHLFGIDGSSCAVADAYICLTPNQTTSFLASDIDPGNRGYFIAIATDCDTGLPKAFNYLIGDSYVKFSSGHAANLAAEAIAAVMWNPAGANPNVRSVTLNFDGMSYNRLPQILAVDNIGSLIDGNSTMLIVNRIGGDLAVGAATIGPLFGFIFNDQEDGFSFTFNPGSCQLKQTLSNSFPRTLTPFTGVIPAGHTGWMKFWSNNDYGLFGAVINFNPNAANSGAFNQGHNLHKLSLAPSATLTIPVVVPFC